MNSSARVERSLPNIWPWIPLLAAFAATWFAARGFPAGNNLYHLPIVLDYAGSAEGPHDTYHVSLNNFISYFWQAVALVSTQDNVRAVFLTLLFAGSMATTWGAYAIAVAAGARRRHAAIGTGFLAFAFAGRDIMEFGGGELFSGFLTHSQIATAIGLFAVALAVRKHWRWAALVCGIVANVNLFLGFWLTLTLLLSRIVLGRREEPRSVVTDCTVMGGLTLIATVPTLAWLLQTLGPKDYPEFSFVTFLYETFPYHSFIHLEPWYAVAFLALSLTAWFSLIRLRESKASDPLAAIILSATLTLLAGCLAMYLSDHRMLQNLYPLRYAALVHWFTAAGVIVVWSRAEKADLDNAVFGAIAVLGFALPTPAVTLLGLLFLLDTPAAASRRRWVLLAALVVTLMLPAFTHGRVDLPKNLGIGPLPALAVICVGGSVLLSVCRHRFSLQSWMPIVLLWLAASTTMIGEQLFAAAFALAVAGIAALILGSRQRRATMFACIIVAALMVAYFALRSDFDKTVIGSLVLALLPFLATRMPILRREWASATVFGSWVMLLTLAGIAFGARLGFDFPRYPKDENWFAAQKWARENTPPDTLFYAPARIGFAVMARRPVWWDEDEFAAIMWSPGFYHQWKERRLRADATRTLDDLLSLAHEYDIRFLVLEASQVSGVTVEGLEVKYCNTDYCIAGVGRFGPAGPDSQYTLNHAL